MPLTTHPDPHYDAAFYADIPGKRLVAWLADSVLIGVITLLVLPFTAFLGLLFLPLLWLGIGVAYRVVTLTRASATPGMRLVAIELRNARGRHLDPGEAFAHTLIYSVCMAFTLLQIGSVALMLTSPKAQGLPDRLLEIVAINRPVTAL